MQPAAWKEDACSSGDCVVQGPTKSIFKILIPYNIVIFTTISGQNSIPE